MAEQQHSTTAARGASEPIGPGVSVGGYPALPPAQSPMEQLRAELKELGLAVDAELGSNPAERNRLLRWKNEVAAYQRELEQIGRTGRGDLEGLLKRAHKTEADFYQVYGVVDVDSRTGAQRRPPGSIHVPSHTVLAQYGTGSPPFLATQPGTSTPGTAPGSGAAPTADLPPPAPTPGAAPQAAVGVQAQLLAQLNQLKQEGVSYWSNRQGYSSRGPAFGRQIDNYIRSVEAVFNGTSQKSTADIIFEIQQTERSFRRVQGGAAAVTITADEFQNAVTQVAMQRSEAATQQLAINRDRDLASYRLTLGNTVLDSVGDAIAFNTPPRPFGGWHVKDGSAELLFRRNPDTNLFEYSEMPAMNAAPEWHGVIRRDLKPTDTPSFVRFAGLIGKLYVIDSEPPMVRPGSPPDRTERDKHLQLLRDYERQAHADAAKKSQLDHAESKRAFETLSELLLPTSGGDGVYHAEFGGVTITFKRDPLEKYQLKWKFGVEGEEVPWRPTSAMPYPSAAKGEPMKRQWNEIMRLLDHQNNGGGFEAELIAAAGPQPPPSKDTVPGLSVASAENIRLAQESYGKRLIEIFAPGATAGDKKEFLVKVGDMKMVWSQDSRNHWVWAWQPSKDSSPMKWNASDVSVNSDASGILTPRQRYLERLRKELDQLNQTFDSLVPGE